MVPLGLESDPGHLILTAHPEIYAVTLFLLSTLDGHTQGCAPLRVETHGLIKQILIFLM